MTNLAGLEAADEFDEIAEAGQLEEPAADQVEEPAEADEIEFLPPDNGDHQLRQLVAAINKSPGLEVPFTLHVGGGIVTGSLVSLRTYAAGVAETMRAANPDSPIGDALAGYFDSMVEEHEAARDEDEHPDEWVNTRCVHLRDAVFCDSKGNRGTTMPWWRGRIGAVAGWSIGFRGDPDDRAN